MISSERKIILTTIAGHGLCHVVENCFPAVALLVSAEFFGAAGEYAEIGLAFFIATLAFGVAAIPSGRLVDMWGPRKMLLVYLIGAGGSMILMGLAQSFWMLTLTLTLALFFAGLYHPSGATLIVLGTTRHGQNMGWHGVGGNLGLALAPTLAGVIAQFLGWRGAFFTLSALPFALAVLVFLGHVDAEVRHTQKENSKLEHEGPRYLLGPLVILFLLGVFNGMAYRGFMTFLPTYFSKEVSLPWLSHYNIAQGGILSTAVLLIGVLSQYYGGKLSDRVHREKLYILLYGISCPLLILLGFLHNLPLLLCASLFALVYFANQPISNAILPRYTSPAMQGSIFGLWFFMNFGAGSIMSLLAGEIGERLGLTRIFPALGLCLLGSLSLAVILVIKTTRPDFQPILRGPAK